MVWVFLVIRDDSWTHSSSLLHIFWQTAFLANIWQISWKPYASFVVISAATFIPGRATSSTYIVQFFQLAGLALIPSRKLIKTLYFINIYKWKVSQHVREEKERITSFDLVRKTFVDPGFVSLANGQCSDWSHDSISDIDCRRTKRNRPTTCRHFRDPFGAKHSLSSWLQHSVASKPSLE